jgi:hypothetical protein
MTDSVPPGEVSPSGLTDFRLELHHAVQLLAAFGQTFVPSRDDDSHRSMTWNSALGGFTSEWGATTPQVRVALEPEGLRVSIRDENGEIAGQSLLGNTLEEAYAWVEAALGAVFGAASGPGGAVTLGRPEYEMPSHPVATGAVFSADGTKAFRELGRWYASAATALHRLRSEESNASEIRCWPHHFDLATLILLDPEIGAEEGRSVGVGFSPGDGGLAQPYWYVNMYPRPEDPELPSLPGGGYWNTDGWLGAVLTGESVVAAGDAVAQDERVASFLGAAVTAAEALL